MRFISSLVVVSFFWATYASVQDDASSRLSPDSYLTSQKMIERLSEAEQIEYCFFHLTSMLGLIDDAEFEKYEIPEKSGIEILRIASAFSTLYEEKILASETNQLRLDFLVLALNARNSHLLLNSGAETAIEIMQTEANVCIERYNRILKQNSK